MKQLLGVIVFLLSMAVAGSVGAQTHRTVCDSGNGCTHTTIAACNTAAVAGDSCILYQPYTANEYFETTKGGTSNDVRLTFIGVGVTIKGFRIRHPYVTVKGFDITGYAGINAAYMRIEPNGDDCEILDNTFRDGMYLSSTGFAFDATARTLTNAAGGFVAAGFAAGVSTYFASFANPFNRPNNHDNNANDGTPLTWTLDSRIIESVTDTVLTFTAAADLWTESGVIGTIYAHSAEKVGIWAIQMINVSSPQNQPDRCRIEGNTFRNLAGRVVAVDGNDHRVARNTFTQLGGWRVLSVVGGNNNVFQFNTIKDSPRWPNFVRPPDANPITNLSRVGSTATATTADPHNLQTADAVAVERADAAEYNGVFTVTVTGANTFTYTVTGTPATPDTSTDIRMVFPTAAGGGTWDMFDAIFEGQADAVTLQADNNRIEDNFIINVDEQFSNIASYTPGLKANGFSFKRNVFVGVEVQGSLTRPGTVFEHNTFYASGVESPHNVNFGYSTIGPSDPNLTLIRNNAFVASGNMTCSTYSGSYCIGTASVAQKAARGWYNNDDGRPEMLNARTPGVESNYNFVTGTEADGWPAKDATFTAEGQEVNGVNGGNPRFMNAADPLGPDGLPFTADDGLQPLANSPMCAAGEGGVDIGAYPCIAAETALVKRVCAMGAPYCTYTTINACAKAATTGMTCLVDSGTYAETVTTAAAGVTYRAFGSVTINGQIEVRHPTTTIDGFIVTDTTPADNTFLITLLSGGTNPGGNGTVIKNNTLRDTCTVVGACPSNQNMGGIGQSVIGTTLSDDVTIQDNTFNNLNYIFVSIMGDRWRVQGNRMSLNNKQEWFRLYGSDAEIRRNVVGPSSYISTSGNHPDFLQMFDDIDGSKSAINTLVEENIVFDLTTEGQQMWQLNNSLGGTNGLVTDFHHVTFRRNVFVNVQANANDSVPYISYQNNTLAQVAFIGTGVGTAGGYLARGEGDNSSLRGNVFLANGNTSGAAAGISTIGFYAPTGESLGIGTGMEGVNREVTDEFPDVCQSSANCPIADSIGANLVANGYTNTNNYPTQAARDLTDISQFIYTPALDSGNVYKQATYDMLTQLLVPKDDLLRSTFAADHNYVAGSPGLGYQAKRADACNCGATFTTGKFCEAAAQCALGGINGGDPNFIGKVDFVRGVQASGQVQAVAWTAATKTLTKTAAFSGITALVPGDRVAIAVGSSLYGAYTVASFTANTLVLDALVQGPGIATDQSSVTVTPLIPESAIFGPDGVPFTLDDGFKPRPGSVLCGADNNKKDIGAYSCDPMKVLETSIRPPTGLVVK